MEHNVYEKVQEYLALLSKIELLTCTVVHNSFKKVRDQAQQVSIIIQHNKIKILFTKDTSHIVYSIHYTFHFNKT